MISIADLNDLDRNPQVAYPEYGDVREAARTRNGGLIAPADLPRMDEVARRRGTDWCRSVVGKPMMSGLRSISATDAVMLIIADERSLEPPEPDWLAQWQAESEVTRKAQEERHHAALTRDRDRWATALAACPVEVEVRPSVNGRRYGSVLGGALRHVVPLADARSPRRFHAAHRPLCEARRTPRQLGDPTGEPATCKSCLTYTAEIKPAAEVPGGQ
jgi:hypothetical protein